jgi:hypothetical protein
MGRLLYGRCTDLHPETTLNDGVRYLADIPVFLDYPKQPDTAILPSHGRGHRFNPCTVHHLKT